jgi:hypothetical protein
VPRLAKPYKTRPHYQDIKRIGIGFVVGHGKRVERRRPNLPA